MTRAARRATLLACVALTACSGSGEGLDASGRPIGEGGAGGPLTADFQSIQDHVFTPICTQCHAGAAAPEGMSLEQGRSYANLVNVASQEVPGLRRVQPGDPDRSYLIHKISGTQAVGERMPRGLPPLPDASIAVIRQWIAAGALPPPPTRASPYTLTLLAADAAGLAHVADPDLVDPWGIAIDPAGPLWLARAGSDSVQACDGTGIAVGGFAVPPAGDRPAAPRGLLFNDGAGFGIGPTSVPAKVIVAGGAGTLDAYAPALDSGNAVAVVDGSARAAAYTGLALAGSGGTQLLYAADFHNGRIDVFDTRFQPVSTAGAFADPALPDGYAPYGVQALGGKIHVAYARRVGNGPGAVAGAGLGLVDAYGTDGQLLQRLVSPGSVLDAPWGLALAPPGFGSFSGALLVANGGDGRINAFDPGSGAWLGVLADARGQALVIPGLHGLAFGNGATGMPATTLFFTAAGAAPGQGTYGRIDPGTVAPDSTTPTVSLQSPAGELVGSVTLVAEVHDDVGVGAVQFYSDGVSIGSDERAPYALSWDTTTASNGAHLLQARAADAAGNIGRSAPLTVTVANPTPDTTPPTVTLAAPPADLHGDVALHAEADDDVGVVQLRFLVDGASIGALNAPPYELTWDSTQIGNGPHTLVAQAEDAAANAGSSAPLGINVANTTLRQVYDDVFHPICSACHDGSSSTDLPGSMNLATQQAAYDNIVGVQSRENPSLRRILPGDPGNSYMIRKVEGAAGIDGKRMPWGCPDTQPCLDAATIARMREWVKAGALNNQP